MHHKTKIYYMGKRLKDIYPHATKWQVFKYKVRMFFRNLFILGLIVSVLVGIYLLGGELNPATIYTKAEVIKEVEVKSNVMDRIAKCESNGQHWVNGQVLVKGNKNGSVDVGKYQINTLWFKKASELGYNLMIEKDNEAFALWLYKEYGTEPWVWTKKCWVR